MLPTSRAKATIFDLQGQDVGRRAIEAIRRAATDSPVDVRASGATFRDAVRLDGCTFSWLDLTGARFDRPVSITNSTCLGDFEGQGLVAPRLTIEQARFERRVLLMKARLTSCRLTEAAFDGYFSFDGARLGQLTARAVRFGAEARFREVSAVGYGADDGHFRRVAFETVASFQRSEWKGLRLIGCRFDGPVFLGGARIQGTLSLYGSKLGDSRALELQAGSVCELSEITCLQPVVIRADAPRVHLRSAVFDGGLDLSLSAGSSLDLAGASLNQASVITTQLTGAERARARLVSVSGTRMASLVLRELDLSKCAFVEAHALDEVLIGGRGQLALAPRETRWNAKREVVADEVLLRKGRQQIRRPYGPATWILKGHDGDVSRSPEAVAEAYRALRRGRESSRDYPGAADFYFGEMEMRRMAAQSVSDRALLGAYWLTSGYGLRASRAFVFYVALVLALALLLDRYGLTANAPFPDVLSYVLATTTVLARPAAELELNTTGTFIQTFARISGPALFVLMIVALRSRLRR